MIPIFDTNIDLLGEFPWYDEFYYSRDLEYYDRFIYRKRFIDSNGRIFIAGEKLKPEGLWSKLGIGKQYRVTFEDTGEEWSFETTRKFLSSLAQQATSEQNRHNWISALNKAKTIKELIGG